MIEKLAQSQGRSIGFRVSGDVSKADYEVLDPDVAQVVAEYGSANLLCDLTDFHWEKAEAWRSDMDFGKKYHKKIHRMAIVGDKRWEKLVADLASPFYATESAFFATQAQAWDWLGE
ncbi:MAG: STAS/SEC14 domain-containing protein [Actinomycetia bacterium]|nr:STAS/SEC14 domain-containing protein [Actinomycetes bacterium]